MYNCEKICYQIVYFLDLQLIMDMLNKALKRVKTLDGLIFYSDKGCISV